MRRRKSERVSATHLRCAALNAAVREAVSRELDALARQYIADSWGGDRAGMVRMTIESGRRLAGSRYLGIIERQRGVAGNGTR